ncbi:MAG TPA: serine/threonine-protein kinase [Gemmataceae bacterium]|jgi:serine/threonine-protein kinase|nr:serine/threonine-protein kinase [Gemmataceae bacterium]
MQQLMGWARAMTTLLHSGHKSIRASHLWDAPRMAQVFPCAPAGVDPLVLGQYRILECLGAGGMGKVFRAEHQLMGRQVAIKVMSAALLSDSESCARFHQEVRLVARLCHPNIVLAHDADEEQGVHFFVMEYVHGADLGQIVAEYGALPIPFACECMKQTALGLQHAHEHGLVHCDIKPSNLLLRDGMTSVYNYLGRQAGENPVNKPLIKILDFGLARLAGKAPGIGERPGSPEPGLCGTPDFMAPELGRDSTTVDIRCDLYSLGCTFSFLLTGQLPYPGGSWSEKLIRHHYDPAIPVCNMRPDVPAAIAGVVGRLMRKDPVDRFSTPGEVASAIQAWQDAESLTQRSAFSRPLDSNRSRIVRQDPPRKLPVIDDGLAPRMDEPRRATHQSRRRLGWPMAACLAIACGFGLAWVASTPLLGKTVRAFDTWTKQANGEALFLVGRDGTPFSRFDQAVAKAEAGDTILVHGNGPFVLHGISMRGKALTIKADAGFQPRFDFVPAQKDVSWEPLFYADRALTLEGLHLHYAVEKTAHPGSAVAHLIYVEGSPLKLLNCKLTATNAQALIVARKSPTIDLDGCSVVANASALCVEVSELGSTKICLQRSQFDVCDPGAAVAAFWANKPLGCECRLELDLIENAFVGSRLLALNGLDRGVSIHAVENSFHFRESLLSIFSTDPTQPLTRLVHWDGSKNRFGGGPKWVTGNSVMTPIGSLKEWKYCWNCSENGSLEASTVTLLTTAQNSN